MNRRSFLAALGVAPIAAAGMAVAAAPKASAVTYSGEYGPEMVIPKSRIGLHVKTEDQFAGLFMEARAGSSRVVFDASQFEIGPSNVDGYSEISPIA